MTSDSDAWWQMIRGNGQPPAASPMNDFLGQQPAQPQGNNALADWLRNPRQPGQSSAAQMPPPTPYTPPPAPPQQNGGTDAAGILQQGYGYHPTMGFVSLSPEQRQQGQTMLNAPTPKVQGNDRVLQWLLSQGMSPYGDQAQGVSGVAGNGPDGTDGGVY